MERANQAAAATQGGKGGGGGLLEKPVRQDFRDTAFWNAHVVTDQAGRAQVSVTLPDNLTTWNMTAKGVSLATLVGEARDRHPEHQGPAGPAGRCRASSWWATRPRWRPW